MSDNEHASSIVVEDNSRRRGLRHDWSVSEIRAIHDGPLLHLVFRAAEIHRRHNDLADIQRASLLFIKTDGYPEDCAYCSQSAHHKGAEEGQGLVDRERLMPVVAVLTEAKAAKAAGAPRFCMAAAWRQPKDGRNSTWCAACALWAWRPASR